MGRILSGEMAKSVQKCEETSAEVQRARGDDESDDAEKERDDDWARKKSESQGVNPISLGRSRVMGGVERF